VFTPDKRNVAHGFLRYGWGYLQAISLTIMDAEQDISTWNSPLPCIYFEELYESL